MSKGQSGTRSCPKCGGKMVNETLEWRCPKCGYKVCMEPEYCLPKDKK